YDWQNFTYYATYFDADNQTPTVMAVEIDGKNRYNMTLNKGTPLTGMNYSYSTMLTVGSHNFTIVYNDGNATIDYVTNVTWWPYVQPQIPGDYINLTNGSVTPLQGDTKTIFTYQVTYSSEYAYPPERLEVVIDNLSFRMNYVSGSNLTGAIYQYKSLLSFGSHNYFFNCTLWNESERLPAYGYYHGPSVGGTQVYLLNGTVKPKSGTVQTIFNYTVIYVNSNNTAPSSALVYIDGKSHSMNHTPGNYTKGVEFWYETQLSAGQHNYHFQFKGDNLSARLPTGTSNNVYYWGPAVFSPTIFLLNGNVTPKSGYLYTLFNYTVKYRGSKHSFGGDGIDNDGDGKTDEELYNGKDDDADGYIDEDVSYYSQDANGSAPKTALVYIDDKPFAMKHTAGDYSKGVVFWFSTNLTAGQHKYYFEFKLENETARWPSNPPIDQAFGPDVNGSLEQLFTTKLEPTEGNITTVFTYTLTYNTSVDYVLPIENVTVVIDNVAFNMTKQAGGANTTMVFKYTTKLGLWQHNYYFTARVAGKLVRIPKGVYVGPVVNDLPPRLYNGSVNPIAGYENLTKFEFSAYYADLEGLAPLNAEVFVNGSYHKMSYISGSNTTGARYSYTTTLPAGNYEFFFRFSQPTRAYRYPVEGNFSGPSVSKQGAPLNYPPELWNGSVTPATGMNDTTFTYRVYYKDKNGDYPITTHVCINGTAYVMKAIEGDYLTGKRYEYSTVLPVGLHNYYFYFKDVNNSVGRLPTIGAYIGPKVLPAPNKPPVLTNGSVTPASGNTSVLFTYRVHYSDAEHDQPSVKTVYIDGYPFTMKLSTGSPSTGWVYSYSSYLGAGNHNYYFLFNDSKNTVRYPISGVFYGPNVTKVPGINNTPPQLSYGRVSPYTGTPTTNFTFYVYYYDADNDTPTKKHVCIDGKLYEMTPSWGQNYPNTHIGLYTYTTTLPAGNHTFYFVFSDGIDTVRLPVTGTYTGPIVSVTPPPNKAPTLSYGTVTPSQGTPTTEFVYSVLYADPEGIAPTVHVVYIDGVPHKMQFKNGSYNTGAFFEYRTTLSAGTHNYRFMFSDGTNTVRLPTTGLYYGPTVTKPNKAPVAEAGVDQVYTVGPPKTVYFDGSKSYDPDGDPLLFFWDFGDGGWAYGEKVSHIFHGVGTYNVTLKVSDGKLTDVDYCAIKIIDSGQGKTQGKAPKKSAKTDSGWVLSPLMIAASIAALGIIAGVIIGGTEWGWYAFASLVIPLYVRYSRKHILDNFTRGKIYGYIIANPGDHYNSIKTALKLKNGALAYHLKTLEREELIKSQSDGNYKRFYPYEMSVRNRTKKLTTMRQNILDHIIEQPGITQSEISEKMGVSHQAISYHLRPLVQLGAVNIEKKGRANHCYVGDYEGDSLQLPDEDLEWL
ncbi:MAG: winged helix-turn-helix transcriptional regulator, partial [Thermoplasmata archaeon]